ncbi:hypothetical protein JW992_00190 [candidate division KSB1 bacterium]|nr:hypothetical protein [candidate division KSB1 bacterium]
MKGIKQIAWDIVIALLIVAGTILDLNAVRIGLYVYTPILLLLKIGLFFSSESVRLKRLKTQIPDWIYHLLYAIDVGFLIAFRWWVLAAMWAVIWTISVWHKKKRESK